ncbi:MAG: radical SAM protein [Candidatus Omnitrophica bacterium]|nr:radical SAM protein [Candidatus Omnitrophota bacterium]
MKILFVYSLQDVQSLHKPLKSPEEIHFGISYISSLLKQHGHQTKLIVLSKVFGKQNVNILDKAIIDFKPRLVCFTAVSSEYGFIAKAARHLKAKNKQIFTLVGGTHVSLNPQEAINDYFDAICVGEGEYPTSELVEQLERNEKPTGIANLIIKQESSLEKNPPRPFIDNLDALPIPDRQMWLEWIDAQPGSRHSVLLGRGCAFECTYCSNHAIKRIASGNYVRLRSPDKIIEEIRWIVDNFPGQKEIYLEVETFYINKDWALRVCEKLEELNLILSNPLTFGVNLRIIPNCDLQPLFIALKKSNFRFVNIGLESGSEEVRRVILKRNYSNSDLINAVKLARKYALKVAFFNLIGVPGETFNDFRETINMNRICLPDWHWTSIFFPYPGTELYKTAENLGLLKADPDFIPERNKAFLDLPGFSRRQIQKSFEWFEYDVYKGIKPIHKILVKVFITKLKTNLYFVYFYRYFSRLRLGKILKKKFGNV